MVPPPYEDLSLPTLLFCYSQTSFPQSKLKQAFGGFFSGAIIVVYFYFNRFLKSLLYFQLLFPAQELYGLR